LETQVEAGFEAASGASSAEPSPSETTEQAAPVENASGASTTDEFADLEQALADDPRKEAFLTRLREQSQKAQEYRSKWAEVEAYTPVLPLVQQLVEKTGLPVEQVAQFLENYDPQSAAQPETPEPTPEDRSKSFAEWLQTKAPSVLNDWELLDPATQEYWADRFELHTERQAATQAQERQQAEQARQQAEMQLKELQQAEKYGGLYREPEYADVIRLAQHAGLDANTVADKLHGAVERLVQQRLAQYQQGKQADAQFPVTAGGASVTPHAPSLNLNERAARLAKLEGQLAASQGHV
jgi:hypothetical protein